MLRWGVSLLVVWTSREEVNQQERAGQDRSRTDRMARVVVRYHWKSYWSGRFLECRCTRPAAGRFALCVVLIIQTVVFRYIRTRIWIVVKLIFPPQRKNYLVSKKETHFCNFVCVIGCLANQSTMLYSNSSIWHTLHHGNLTSMVSWLWWLILRSFFPSFVPSFFVASP